LAERAAASRGEAFRNGVRDLRQAGIDSALMDAMVLLGHVTGTETGKVLVEGNQQLAESERELFEEMIVRRCRYETVSRILGAREFMSMSFRVSSQVLDPRPETELLVERAVQFLKLRSGNQKVLDIGTGSGAIAVSLAVHAPEAMVVASDISDPALRLARVNTRDHQAEKRVSFIRMDLAEGLVEGALFDLVVSNPPYVSEKEYTALTPDVRHGDPRMALVAGPEGTEFYPLLASQAARVLKPAGGLMVEVGAGQAARVADILADNGYGEILTFKDLSGTDRIVTGISKNG
jgi:release factor glutamine methyltransferase